MVAFYASFGQGGTEAGQKFVFILCLVWGVAAPQYAPPDWAFFVYKDK